MRLAWITSARLGNMPVEIGGGSYQWQRRGEQFRWDRAPGKKRYIPFYENVVAGISAGMTPDEAAFEAGKKMEWMQSPTAMMSDEQVRKKALKILRRPDAPAQLGKFFKQAADYDPVDMAQDAVKFIRGEMTHTRIVLDKEGTQHEITENLPPSEGMLKAVMGAVLPKQVKQVQIDTRMQVMKIGMSGEAPPMLRARTLETIEGETE